MAEKNEQEKLKELIGENNQKGSHWWDDNATFALIATWFLIWGAIFGLGFILSSEILLKIN